jgi:hypothetical protein
MKILQMKILRIIIFSLLNTRLIMGNNQASPYGPPDSGKFWHRDGAEGNVYQITRDATLQSFIIFFCLFLGGLAIFFYGLFGIFKLGYSDEEETPVSTLGNTILYPFGEVNSNLVSRENIDDNCKRAIPDDIKCVVGSVHGFISVNENDSISSMPENFGYDRTKPVVGYTGLHIADNWGLLIRDDKGSVVKKALFPPNGDIGSKFFWSGSNKDGTTDVSSTCGNWRIDDKSLNAKGRQGYLEPITGESWLSNPDDETICGDEVKVLVCACIDSGETSDTPEEQLVT